VALDEDYNHRQRLEDINRLAGDAEGLDIADADDLVASRNTFGQAAFLSAVGRLGGPVVHGTEFVTPTEAAGHWGRMILGAPTDGQSVAAAVRFEANFEGAREIRNLTWEQVTEDLVIDTPFQFDGAPRRGAWSAQVTLTWRGMELTANYQSATLFPNINLWEVAVYDAEETTVSVERVANGLESGERFEDALRAGGLATDTVPGRFLQDPMETTNFTAPYFLRLWELYADELAASEHLAGFFVTRCASSEERDAILEFRASGAVWVAVNGEAVNTVSPDVDPGVPGYFLPPLRTAPFRLEKGANRIVVHTQALLPQTGRWFLGAGILAPDGRDILDLAFS
jgi:hypothetical protein